jgi:hypothetical protein
MERLASAFLEWQATLGVAWRVIHTDTSLEATLEALLPLSNGKRRRAFIATRSGWTAQFQNGIKGSDPFPVMNLFAARLGVLAMRVCSTTIDKLYTSNIWEVYAPPHLGGSSFNYRRSIAVANDGGKWTFDQSGAPYGFEDLASYSAFRKRDRFTREMLERYLAAFDLYPFDEKFYVVDAAAPAIVLERPAHSSEPPDFTLKQVIEGKPWVRV